MNSHLKIAFKVLGRRRFFTFISLFGISMTLVVLMVATAMLDNLFAPRAPESRFGRVLTVYRITMSGKGGVETTEPGFAFVQRFVKTLPDIERASVYSNPEASAVYKGSSRIDVSVKRTDADYWKILDFRFLEGRPFTSTEDGSGALVAVISDELRDKLFAGGPATGGTFELDGQRFRVIGVVPHVSRTRLSAWADIWAPVGSLRSSDYRYSYMGGFHALVLAHSRSDFPRLKRVFLTSLRDVPFDRRVFDTVTTGLDTPFEAVARLVTWNRAGARAPWIVAGVLAALALLFMTLPALNLVTLNLSRILERAPEIGVRKAFGAPRPALVGQFVLENVVLTLIGGVIGFILSAAVLLAVRVSGVVPGVELDLNVRIFFWGMSIAVLFGVFSGLYPAWRMSRLDPVTALRGGAL